MDSELERVFAWLTESGDRDPERKELVAELDMFKRYLWIGDAFNSAEKFRNHEIEFSKPSASPLSMIKESVDDNLAWQAGQDLCEAWDRNSFGVAGDASGYNYSDLRVLSPMWCAKVVENLEALSSTKTSRLRSVPLEPADPKVIQIYQSFVDLYASSTDDERAEVDTRVVRFCWWSYIRTELPKNEADRTRLGTKVKRHWWFVERYEKLVNCELPPERIDRTEQFPDDNKEDRVRLRLQTSAIIQAAACGIVSERLKSNAEFQLETLLRQIALIEDADSDADQPTADAAQTSDQPHDGKTPATQSTNEYRKRKKTTRRPPKREWPTEPTNSYQFGHVEGMLKEFSEWLGVSDEALHKNNGKGSYMVCKEHRTLYRCWFKDSKRFADINAKSLAAKDSNPPKTG